MNYPGVIICILWGLGSSVQGAWQQIGRAGRKMPGEEEKDALCVIYPTKAKQTDPKLVSALGLQKKSKKQSDSESVSPDEPEALDDAVGCSDCIRKRICKNFLGEFQHSGCGCKCCTICYIKCSCVVYLHFSDI